MERNDIIKALEVCVKGNACTLCPLVDDMSCAYIINKNALALITSQEQRIKELTEDNERLRDGNETLEMLVKDLRGRNNGLQRANESIAKDCDILEDELNECVQIKSDTVRNIFCKLESKLRISFINGDEENAMLIIGYDDYDAIKKEMGVNQDE
jgi:predicted RNase H-like nuclease (RuvC/YqgF family)